MYQAGTYGERADGQGVKKNLEYLSVIREVTQKERDKGYI